MKKIFAIAAITCAVIFTAAVIGNSQKAEAQNMIVNKKTVAFTAPIGITTNKYYLHPTFDYQAKTYADTVTVTINQLETWVYIDTLKGSGLLILAPQSHILPGAKLWVQCGKDGSNRTLTIKQGSYALDTLSVGNSNVKRSFVYNGIKYEKI